MIDPKERKLELIRAAELYAKACDIMPTSGHALRYRPRVEVHAFDDDVSVTVRFTAVDSDGRLTLEDAVIRP